MPQNPPVYLFCHEKKVYQPDLIVTDFGWMDLFLPHFPVELLNYLHQRELEKRAERAPDKVQLIRAVLLHSDSSAREIFNANRKSWTKAGIALYQQAYFTVRESLKTRALHYRRKDGPAPQVFFTPLKTTGRYPSMVAVLCNAIPTEEAQDLKVFDNVGDAMAGYDPGGEAPLELRGHNAAYGDLFGGNPAYLFSKVAPEQIYQGRFMSFLSAVQSNDAEYLKQQGLLALKTAILTDPNVVSAGMVELKDDTGQVIATVPKLPLACWSIKMAGGRHELMYKPYSPQGLKLPTDCRYHSDWMVAAGLDLLKDYRSGNPIQNAAWLWGHEYQKAQLGVEHMVLSHHGRAQGRLRFATPDNAAGIEPGDIVVLPHAGPQYQLHLEQACRGGGGGGIALIGHQAAHLCKISRERGITLVLVPRIKTHFVEGQLVCVDPDTGTVNAVKPA